MRTWPLLFVFLVAAFACTAKEAEYSQDVTDKLGEHPIRLNVVSIYCIKTEEFRLIGFSEDKADVVINDSEAIQDILSALTERHVDAPVSVKSLKAEYWNLFFLTSDGKYGKLALMIPVDDGSLGVFGLKYEGGGGSWGFWRLLKAQPHFEKYLGNVGGARRSNVEFKHP